MRSKKSLRAKLKAKPLKTRAERRSCWLRKTVFGFPWPYRCFGCRETKPSRTNAGSSLKEGPIWSPHTAHYDANMFSEPNTRQNRDDDAQNPEPLTSKGSSMWSLTFVVKGSEVWVFGLCRACTVSPSNGPSFRDHIPIPSLNP